MTKRVDANFYCYSDGLITKWLNEWPNDPCFSRCELQLFLFETPPSILTPLTNKSHLWKASRTKWPSKFSLIAFIECMYFGSKSKLFQLFQDESGTSENENFKMKMRYSMQRRNIKERQQWWAACHVGALGLVDLVSNHDGSWWISLCGAAGRQKRGLTQKLILKFFTDPVVLDAIWNLEQFWFGTEKRMSHLLWDA
jgi:hypothetical protein